MAPVARRESTSYWRDVARTFEGADGALPPQGIGGAPCVVPPRVWHHHARAAVDPKLAEERGRLQKELEGAERRVKELERRRDEATAMAERQARRRKAEAKAAEAEVLQEHAHHYAGALREDDRKDGQRHGFRKAFQVPHGYGAKPLGCGVGMQPFAHVAAAPLFGGAATQVEASGI